MAKAEPIKLIFQVERETKSKVRFQEMNPVDGNRTPAPVTKEKAVVEKLYVSKKDLKKMGNPEILYVTIESP